MKLLTLLVAAQIAGIAAFAGDKKPDKPLSKAEQAVRAGKDIHKVNPAAAKHGEKPRKYGSPDGDGDRDDKDKDHDKDHDDKDHDKDHGDKGKSKGR